MKAIKLFLVLLSTLCIVTYASANKVTTNQEALTTDYMPTEDTFTDEFPTTYLPEPLPAPEQQDFNRKMKQRHEKWGKQMKQKEIMPKFAPEQVKQAQDFSKFKNQILGKLMQQSMGKQQQTSPNFQSFLSIERSIPEVDDPKKFFPHTAFTTNIYSIPSAGRVAVEGWSGSYWPMRNGGLSVRYNKNDRNTIGFFDPTTGVYYTLFNWSQSVWRYAQPADHQSIENTSTFAQFVEDNYSPAEKYDLLVGDYDYTLTNFSKNEGIQYQFGGDVIGWFGICHGWAIASVYYPKPQHSVTLTAANGLPIRFTRDDIKGLASLFWANAEFKTLFIGMRCNYYYPDPGWFSSPGCLSINPASFYIIVGNQVGLYGGNLTFDPSADPEIWNEPIKSYEFRFYNPITGDFFPDIASAKISMDYVRGSTDSWLQYFAANADAKATQAIGVFMKITYTQLSDITDLRHDETTADDTDKTEEFDSVLGLDAGNNIVGGDWKFKSHPNFIWYFDPTEPIEGVADKDVPFFGGSPDTLREITKFAKEGSAKGQPLRAIVDFLTLNAAS